MCFHNQGCGWQIYFGAISLERSNGGKGQRQAWPVSEAAKAWERRRHSQLGSLGGSVTAAALALSGSAATAECSRSTASAAARQLLLAAVADGKDWRCRMRRTSAFALAWEEGLRRGQGRGGRNGRRQQLEGRARSKGWGR